MKKQAHARDSKTAIGYVRVSSEEQAREGVSLDAQDERIRAYAVARGLTLTELVREEGVSAGKPLASRPEGARVLESVAAGSIGAVIVVKLDRLFRNAADALNVTSAWDKAGVSLHVIDMGGNSLDTASAMGRMFLTMAAGFAELERNLIGERTSTALQHIRKQGVRLGGEGLGWERTEETDADGRHIVRDVPEEAETVQRIKALRHEGKTLRQIAEALTSEGRKTKRGGDWHPMAIQRVLARVGA